MECSAAPAMIAQDIIKMLEDRGRGDYIGESISQLEHCLQCADLGRKAGTLSEPTDIVCTMLTQRAGQDDDIIIAALLHDIGQFLPVDEARDISMGIGEENVGRVGHESIGEEYLKRLGFGEKITRLVGSHVAAKRYVISTASLFFVLRNHSYVLIDTSPRLMRHTTMVSPMHRRGA